MDARLEGFKVARIVAWSLAAAIIVLSIVPPAVRPETNASHNLEHFLIYSATGFAFGWSHQRRHDFLAVLLVLFSGGIEIAQLFMPGRHARLSDFIIDALAACVGLFMSSLIGMARA
jgi:VanZ family protein